MKESDIAPVAEIDREAFSSEWMFRSYASYKQDLSNPVARYVVAYAKREFLPKSNQDNMQQLPWFKRILGLDASGNEETVASEYIIGFAGFWLMLREAHIIAIAVRAGFRQLGVGEALLISIIDLATELSASTLSLEVRASNHIAQALYEKYGFEMDGRRRNYYSDNGEDALLMRIDSIISEQFQARLRQLKNLHAQKRSILSQQFLTSRIS
jgi:[ribosomal protein S18]-alanine N-acetyltransferase